MKSKKKRWCGRGDSNPHGLATVSPSSWCVCQFRHFRTLESPLAAHYFQSETPRSVYPERNIEILRSAQNDQTKGSSDTAQKVFSKPAVLA